MNVLRQNIHSVLIALGSNLGDKSAHIESAIQCISELPETKLFEKSKFVASEAEEASQGQDFFLNAVIRIETELQPVDLLEKLQVIERKLGRQTKGDGAERTIDLDILSFGEAVIHGKNLNIPHPRLHLRRFVLEPLAEIQPEWVHPKLKKTTRQLLEDIANKTETRDPASHA